jgi:hypothetical protein
MSFYAPKGESMGLLLAAGIILSVSLALAVTGIPGPPCLFRALYGIPCPGCGLTRSLLALWHGDLRAAVLYHPLGAPLFFVCLTLCGVRLLSAIRRKRCALENRLFETVSSPRFAGIALCLLLGVWLIRLLDRWAGWYLFPL